MKVHERQSSQPPIDGRALLAIGAAIARRPSLWGTAMRQAWRLAPSGWWRRFPFLPLPSGDYARFRTLTQYGQTDRPPVPSDVVDYLAWCQQWDRSQR